MASSSMPSSTTLRFDDGAVQFRQRVAVSVLSCKPLFIRNVRSDEYLESPGLRPYEVSFLRLIDSITNGSRIEINNTGTQLKFVPGVLVGGDVEHECPVGGVNNDGDEENENASSNSSFRSIGWFLEGILPLAPFGKEPLSVVFKGVTDGCSNVDPSQDYLKLVALPLLRKFGVGSGGTDSNINADRDILSTQDPAVRVLTRGGAPSGGGRVHFYCPIVRRELQPIDFTVQPGDSSSSTGGDCKFKRIRGTVISTKVVSSSTAARAAYAAKGVFHRLLPDVWIHTDCHSQKQHKCGPSPSLSFVAAAQTTTGGIVIAAECCLEYSNNKDKKRELPEDLGKRGACMLLEEIRKGGCVDTGIQSLALLWMCLTSEDVNRIRFGTLSGYAVESLRLFKRAFGVEFKVTADQETKTVLLSCYGTGYRNMARAST